MYHFLAEEDITKVLRFSKLIFHSLVKLFLQPYLRLFYLNQLSR